MADSRYESTFIIKGSLGDEQIDTVVAKFEELITRNGGTVIEMERWGRRKLAYDIGKESQGYYVSAHFTSPGATIARVERMYNLDENVVRWLTLHHPESSVKGRIAMKKRAEEVNARREAAAAAEAAALDGRYSTDAKSLAK